MSTAAETTHLISVPNEGTPEVIRNRSAIVDLEDYLDGIDTAYDVVLPLGSPDESDPDESLKARAQAIKKAILEAANTFYLIAEPGHITIEGHAPTVVITKPDEQSGD